MKAQSGGQEWRPRVEAKIGGLEWRHRVEALMQTTIIDQLFRVIELILLVQLKVFL